MPIEDPDDVIAREVPTEFMDPRLPGSAAHSTATLTFYDTNDYDLLSRDVELTFDGFAQWHCSVAAESVLAMEGGTAVPKQVAELVIGLRRGRPLRAAAVVVRERREYPVGRSGSVIVDDHRATVPGEAAMLISWRNVTVDGTAYRIPTAGVPDEPSLAHPSLPTSAPVSEALLPPSSASSMSGDASSPGSPSAGASSVPSSSDASSADPDGSQAPADSLSPEETGPVGDSASEARAGSAVEAAVEDQDAVASIRAKVTAIGRPVRTSAAKLAMALGALPRRAENARGEPSAVQVVLDYLRDQDRALLIGDLGLRQGRDVVHPTRVAVRRLRSTLRTFSALFDPLRAAAFDAELTGYAALLGEVRNREVQRARFAASVAALPGHLVIGPVAYDIEDRLLTEQTQHTAALLTALNSRRYLAMLQESSRWSTGASLAFGADPDAEAIARAVAGADANVEKRLRSALRPKAVDGDLHAARKSAKRARYAAELAAPILGQKRADKSVRRFTGLQEILGDFEDSIEAAQLLLRLAKSAGGNGFTYGLLYAQELEKAQLGRERARAWRG